MSASTAPAAGALTGLTAWGLATLALRLLMPRWPADELAAVGGFLLAFALLALVVVAGAHGAARAAVPGRLVLLALLPAGVVVALGLGLDLPEAATDLLLGAAILNAGLWLGAHLGHGVTRASHLWPLVVVAVGADVWSVTSAQGVTHQLVVEGQAAPDAWWLKLVVLHLPVPGVGNSALLGVGDVLFCGLLAGAVERLDLGHGRLALGLLTGFACTLAVLVIFAVPVPALCFLAPLGVAALGRRARPSAREMALAMGVVVALFGIQLALR